MTREYRDDQMKRGRGLEVFLSLPEDQRVPHWNVNGLKDTVDATEAVRDALDAAVGMMVEEPTIGDGQ